MMTIKKYLRALLGNAQPQDDTAQALSTEAYWEGRYQGGRSSGAGSYGRLAEFKAEVLNDFVQAHDVQSVIEFGCGDGNQLSLATYPRYIGLDIAKAAVEGCIQRYADDADKSFFLYHSACFADNAGVFQAELALSLDVLFHILEEAAYQAYLRHLFGAAARYVVIYSSNEDRPQTARHVRHRRFTETVEQQITGWRLMQTIPNRYPYQWDAAADQRDEANTSFSDFYIYQPT